MRYRCHVCQGVFRDVDQSHEQQLNELCPTCGHADIEELLPKVCPVLSIGHAIPQTCIHESCAAFNEYFQMCNTAIPGFLNAREEMQQATRKGPA